MGCTGKKTCGSDHDAFAERLVSGDPGERLKVIETLEKRTRRRRCCSCEDLLALAYFHDGQYQPAVDALSRLIKSYDPEQQDALWQRRLNDASINVFIRVRERGKDIPLPKYPQPPPPATPQPDLFEESLSRFFQSLVDMLGLAGTLVLKIIVWLHDKIFPYNDQVWTNWYRRGLYRGILTLIAMRDRLNRENLHSAYADGQLTEGKEPGQHPPAGAVPFRTASGMWNDLDDPMQGAAGTRFSRNVPHKAAPVRSVTRKPVRPNPHDVSRALLARNGEPHRVESLNLLAVAWIQFMVHDWMDHGQEKKRELRIPVNSGSELRDVYRVGALRAKRTLTKDDYYYNDVTHWWDGSQIYGSNEKLAANLRSREHGKLKLDKQGLIPRRSDDDPVDNTGFHRNWWIGLSLMHNLFVWEHNAICDRLLQTYPQWDDDRLYNVARLINAAVMAKIHTVEWTPAILSNATVTSALNANWYGLLTYAMGRRRPNQRRALSRVNIPHAELGGVVGNPGNKHGVPFSFTEEFVEVYRMHCLFPDGLRLRGFGGRLDCVMELQAARDSGARYLLENIATADLFNSLAIQNPGALVLNNYPGFMRRMSTSDFPFFDLGAVDIQRERERNVPLYNDLREGLGLNRVPGFDELVKVQGRPLTPAQQSQVKKLTALYKHIDNLDFLVGCLAEGTRPYGFGFGETVFQVFIVNATRRLEADRFYTEFYDEATYTREGLQWIDDADMKSVLLRHLPELAETNLAHVRNAFEPWDVESLLSVPERHPLRQFDKDFNSVTRFMSDDRIPVLDIAN